MQKSDIDQIGKLVRKIVREEVEAESKDITRTLDQEIRMSRMHIQQDISELDDRMKNVEIRVDNLGKDIVDLKKDVTDVKKRVRKIEKHVNTIAILYDETDVKLAKRVSKIEGHLGIASNA